jgi:NADPH-dependent 2,4-dienoyl-CoA reductase/sulfur reductase-like enzyme
MSHSKFRFIQREKGFPQPQCIMKKALKLGVRRPYSYHLRAQNGREAELCGWTGLMSPLEDKGYDCVCTGTDGGSSLLKPTSPQATASIDWRTSKRGSSRTAGLEKMLDPAPFRKV